MQPNNFGNPNFDQPKKKSSALYWLLGIGAVLLLSCCCCGGGSYFLFNQGMSILSEQVKNEVAGNSVITENIGDIQKFEVDIIKTGQVSEGQEERLAFRIEGSKGKGYVLAKQAQGGQGIEQAELVLDSGETLPIDLNE